MNIYSFNPALSSLNTNNNIVSKKAKSDYNFSNVLHQDTVSFGAGANVRKKVLELKGYNSSGNYDVKRRDVVKIYEYFGYKQTGTGKHDKFTGPYGQVLTLASKDPVDAGCANDLISAIKRADSLNGELVIFSNEPSAAELLTWKDRLSSSSPKEGFVNQYAQEMLPAANVEDNEISVEKETQKQINQLKTQIDTLNKKITNYEQSLNELSQCFEKDKVEWSENKVAISPDTITFVETSLSEKKAELEDVKKCVNYYKSKLNDNNMLSDEELEKLNQYSSQQFDLAEIKQAIDEMEAEYLLKLDEKDLFSKKIDSTVTEVESYISNVSSKLEEVENEMQEPAVRLTLKKDTLIEMESLLCSLKQGLGKLSRKLEEYTLLDVSSFSISELESKLQALTNVGTNDDKLHSQYQELLSLYEQNVLSITKASADSKRIEKFEKKYGAKPQVEQKTQAEAPQVQTSVVENEPIVAPVVNVEPEVKSVVVEEKRVEPQVVLENVQPVDDMPPAPLAQDVKPVVQLSFKDAKIQKIKEKLISKIVPLPIPSVVCSISDIVDSKFDIDRFDKIESGEMTVQTFASDIVREVSKTAEYSMIKNATRFAFLHSVYSASENKPEAIYKLDSKQTKQLYEMISKGNKDIRLSTSDGYLDIVLSSAFNMSSVEELFNAFNISVSSPEKRQDGRCLDKLLQYLPFELTDSDEIDVIKTLLTEGSYYELLLEDESSPVLIRTLLELFWKKYDAQNGKSVTPLVISKYEQIESERETEAMQQMKLESVDEVDWTL